MKDAITDNLALAILIPCYNEASTIEQVIRDFQGEFPTARVVVFDNNSTDHTGSVADAAGAEVHTVLLQGKGNVIRRMFADIEADLYLMVDGDDTYDAKDGRTMLHKLITEHLDMVVGTRISQEQAAYRAGHRWGNEMINRVVASIFGRSFSDMLSGYRVMSKRFVKSFPALSQGFETETELTIHALDLRMPIGEVESHYKSRPTGSHSKLNTYSDGFRILVTILKLFEQKKPLLFFFLITLVLVLISITLAFPLLITYMETGLVPRFPTAILSTGLMMLASFSLVCGLILHAVSHARHEVKRLHYLSISSPAEQLYQHQQQP